MTLDELRNELEAAFGRIDCVYLHWTGGGYDDNEGAYNLSIDGDGNLTMTRSLTNAPAATYMRNYRSLAVTLNCCRGAILYGNGRSDFGDCPPTDEQIECMAQVIAVISDTLHLPIRKSLFMTHAEAAELDEYGPNTTCERWDLWTLPQSPEWGSGGNFIRGKALFYQNEGV